MDPLEEEPPGAGRRSSSSRGLALFTVAGPWLWRVDPGEQVLDPHLRAAEPAGDRAASSSRSSRWAGVAPSCRCPTAGRGGAERPAARRAATTQAVRLRWAPVPGAAGYHVYRNLRPSPIARLGLPIGGDPRSAARQRSRTASISSRGRITTPSSPSTATESSRRSTRPRRHARARRQRGGGRGRAAGSPAAQRVRIGDELAAAGPPARHRLSRPRHARAAHGRRARVALHRLRRAALLVAFGVFFGGAAGFFGGRVDQWLMRFADFVVALPFLLFMILFKIAFGIGPARAACSRCSSRSSCSPGRRRRGSRAARSCRSGTKLHRRVAAARRAPGYLVLRHMLPNTIGVILVTLTFEIPRASSPRRSSRSSAWASRRRRRRGAA